MKLNIFRQHTFTCLITFSLFLFSSLANAQLIPATKTSENIRAFHIVMVKIDTNEAMNLIDSVSQHGFNVLIIDWRDGVDFSSYPGILQQKRWNKADLKAVIEYASSKHLEVIPEIKLLTHQEKLFKNKYPELMYNKASYDPSNPEVQKKIILYLDEIIDLIKPKAIHIGHDEVIGWNKVHMEKTLGSGAQTLPAELFLKDVKILHDYLSKKGVQTWMWGDMLISPDEFSNGGDRDIHGNMPGYGKQLRQKIPKSIVICDWHYGRTTWREYLLSSAQTEFSSISLFRSDGFTVLGASWKDTESTRNFSREAAKQGASGMISTTWFHVQRKEWEVVDNIIHESGKAFFNDFPNESLPLEYKSK